MKPVADPEIGAFLGAHTALFRIWQGATQMISEQVTHAEGEVDVEGYFAVIRRVAEVARLQYIPPACHDVHQTFLEALQMSLDVWVAAGSAPNPDDAVRRFTAALRDLAEQMQIVLAALNRLSNAA